jgi:serine/threonine protein kinase
MILAALLLQVLLEVARSIQYLHGMNIIHCDVKVGHSDRQTNNQRTSHVGACVCSFSSSSTSSGMNIIHCDMRQGRPLQQHITSH